MQIPIHPPRYVLVRIFTDEQKFGEKNEKIKIDQKLQKINLSKCEVSD